ncbi:serine--tRNA ligase, mitochondrial-like [Octopus sinensis]|uniref:Serine--tRNA ligase, mitochondrial-like n=1 Tax=Octopus sinensis TaxID=2607531 RepID=A0A7E6EGL1_9MOLL|nr:serine--tRNA ligase, mitochondrial-like [Octopus sinensis]
MIEHKHGIKVSGEEYASASNRYVEMACRDEDDPMNAKEDAIVELDVKSAAIRNSYYFSEVNVEGRSNICIEYVSNYLSRKLTPIFAREPKNRYIADFVGLRRLLNNILIYPIIILALFQLSNNDYEAIASYKIAEIIAKTSSSHTIAENVIIPSVEVIISDVMHQDASKIIKSLLLPLSNDSICRRIDEMGDNGLSLENIKELSKRLKAELENFESALVEYDRIRKAALYEIANELDPRVVISNNEDNNPIIRTNGDINVDKPLSHVDLLEMIGGVDYERGSAVGGSRCYYLKGPGVYLESALVQYALFFLHDREYEVLKPPYMMKKEIMSEVAQLSQFDEELYKVFHFSIFGCIISRKCRKWGQSGPIRRVLSHCHIRTANCCLPPERETSR